MTEPHKRSLLERLSALLMREPEDRGELLNLLHAAYEKNLLDADALSMIEGVMQGSAMQVGEMMGPAFSDEDYDTVGGLVLHKFGRLPKRGESVIIEGLRFAVLRADSRRLHLPSVQKLPGP